MSARSAATGGSALYQGAGFRRAARLVLAMIVALLMSAAVVRGGPGAADGLALLAAAICIAGLWETRVRRMGIRIEPQGILAVYAVGHLRFPLETVVGFSLLPKGSHSTGGCVCIELLSGERRVVPSASRLRWAPITNRHLHRVGSQAADVVAQLNDLLQRARLQAAAALTDALSAAP